MNMQTYANSNSRTKTLVVNTQAYTERSDGLYLQQNKTDSLTFLSGSSSKFASKNAQKSIAPGDFRVQLFNSILILTSTKL